MYGSLSLPPGKVHRLSDELMKILRQRKSALLVNKLPNDKTFGWLAELGSIYYGAMALVAAALVFEHQSARRLDVAAINRAFFQSNAFVSAVFLAAVCADQCLR